jgi:glycosyltransferase involved in cell wall biosynthesis
VLLLATSAGLGGGIERYLGTIEEALEAGGADLTRVDLLTPGRAVNPATRIDFATRTLGTARRLGRVDAVVAGHPNLLKVAALASAITGAPRTPVLCYGNDIWTMRATDRLLLAHHPRLLPLTISSFSAGALSATATASVLPPGLSPAWRATLLAEGARRRPLAPVPTVLSVFRLSEWTGKGLPTLLDALEQVRATVGPVRLVVAGRGPAPGALHERLSTLPDAELLETPDDSALARLYATADLFALCTRTRSRRPHPTGEGYGIVLLEAQLAGCAVVGPASGGSRDAYQEGVTGATPANESAAALADVLTTMLRDRARLTRIGRRGAAWAEAATVPEDHMRAVYQAVIGQSPVVDPSPTDTPDQRTGPEQSRDAAASAGRIRP